ncbi:hypothetical protein [Halobaculum sp. P14]|uniref:hypothetical protein n=1 Tax=Halobaculum sp. P14 TaxID=3421638 RepID=UPI003EBFD2F5
MGTSETTEYDIVVIAVGHGARVGLDVVTDYRRVEEGLWEAAADHTDWVVQQGRYAGDDWLERSAEYTIESAPDGLDDEFVQRKSHELAKGQQGWQVDEAEVEHRTERAHRRLLDHVDDDLIREYAADLDVPEVPG